MPEVRFDSVRLERVIFAPERALRPLDFALAEPARPALHVSGACPFCAGHEALTPHALASYPPNESAWQVRVVPNKFPAVAADAVEPAPADAHCSDGCLSAAGRHEVVVESPDHVQSFSTLTDSQLAWAFRAYRDRLLAAAADQRLRYGLVFKNSHAQGGASLEHVHSQFMATTFVPPSCQFEQSRAGEQFALTGACPYCRRVEDERRGPRLLAESANFVAFCPFASRFAYEMCVLPKEHVEAFEQHSADELSELGRLVRDLIRRLEATQQSLAYNFWLHTAPFHRSRFDLYHWRLEIVPRRSRLAGFELATGCFINAVYPELAAQQLRDAATP